MNTDSSNRANAAATNPSDVSELDACDVDDDGDDV